MHFFFVLLPLAVLNLICLVNAKIYSSANKFRAAIFLLFNKQSNFHLHI